MNLILFSNQKPTNGKKGKATKCMFLPTTLGIGIRSMRVRTNTAQVCIDRKQNLKIKILPPREHNYYFLNQINYASMQTHHGHI